MARDIAIRTGTPIIIRRDGQMVRVTSEELQREDELADATHAVTPDANP